MATRSRFRTDSARAESVTPLWHRIILGALAILMLVAVGVSSYLSSSLY